MPQGEKNKMILFSLTIIFLVILLIFTSSVNPKNSINKKNTINRQKNTNYNRPPVSPTAYTPPKPYTPPAQNIRIKETTITQTHPKIMLTKNDGDIHVISVYSGNYKGSSSPNHERGDVNIQVNVKNKPIVLFLNAYEPVSWHIKLANGAKISQIILTGYYNQEIELFNKSFDTILISNYYELKSQTTQETQESKKIIKEITGEEPASIQYEHTGKDFVIKD